MRLSVGWPPSLSRFDSVRRRTLASSFRSIAYETARRRRGPVGDTIYDLSHQWSAPLDTNLGFWLITQPDRTIAAIDAGQTAVVTYDISFSHPVAVLFAPVGPTGNNGPFVITEEGPAICQITAT
jgi:hypothetical protein